MVSSLENWSVSIFRRRAISLTMALYSGEPVVAYRLSVSSGMVTLSAVWASSSIVLSWLPVSKSRITRRAMSSSSFFEAEKLTNGHAQISGGQAMRICTSLAPRSFRICVFSLSCVPRTMLSSQKRHRLPWSMAWLGMSFILATRLRISWLAGMKERGHVGVYFDMHRW